MKNNFFFDSLDYEFDGEGVSKKEGVNDEDKVTHKGSILKKRD